MYFMQVKTEQPLVPGSILLQATNVWHNDTVILMRKSIAEKPAVPDLVY